MMMMRLLGHGIFLELAVPNCHDPAGAHWLLVVVKLRGLEPIIWGKLITLYIILVINLGGYYIILPNYYNHGREFSIS